MVYFSLVIVLKLVIVSITKTPKPLTKRYLVNVRFWVSQLIAGMEYGMEQWNGIWNGR